MAAARDREEEKMIQEAISAYIKDEDVWDNYEKGNQLGTGAYGKVYSAEALDDLDGLEAGDTVAVKAIEKTGNMKSLGREIKVALEAEHPNLLPIHAIYHEGVGKPMHLVMDYVKCTKYPQMGQSDLFEYIVKVGCLDTKQACQLAYQTASALAYLNSHQTIHRDLKPENILLGEEVMDRIRVMDYGLARCLMGDEQLAQAGTEMTANVGSGGYQAPEILAKFRAHTTYGPAVDIWSLGVILYIAVRGAAPFGLGPGANLPKIMKGQYKPMTDAKWAKVDPGVKQLIQKMLIVDPSKRMTAHEIMADPFVMHHAGIDPDSAEARLNADLVRVASM